MTVGSFTLALCAFSFALAVFLANLGQWYRRELSAKVRSGKYVSSINSSKLIDTGSHSKFECSA